MNFYISDLHFGHKNALSFDDRPFTTIEEHDNLIIKNWNEVVNIDDDVYILGDISWYNVTKTIEIIKTLNGHKHLIIGNHDDKFLKNKDFRDCFVEICNYKEIRFDEEHGVVLCHYPIPCFNNHYYGWYHLYGHVHTGWEYNIMKHVKLEMSQLYDKPCNMFNVGCMVSYMHYTPQPLNHIANSFEEG